MWLVIVCVCVCVLFWVTPCGAGCLKSLLNKTWNQCAGRRNASRHSCETRHSKYARRPRNRAHAALRRAMASRARHMTHLLSKTGDACSKSAAGMRDDVRGRCELRNGASTLGLAHQARNRLKAAAASASPCAAARRYKQMASVLFLATPLPC
jgi:hypothetical protein